MRPSPVLRGPMRQTTPMIGKTLVNETTWPIFLRFTEQATLLVHTRNMGTNGQNCNQKQTPASPPPPPLSHQHKNLAFTRYTAPMAKHTSTRLTFITRPEHQKKSDRELIIDSSQTLCQDHTWHQVSTALTLTFPVTTAKLLKQANILSNLTTTMDTKSVSLF
jgi:hypothetical protein